MTAVHWFPRPRSIFRIWNIASIIHEADALNVPIRRWMISSIPANEPPQMNRMCVVSIWMYCCSGCFRPPCGGTFATTPSSIFSKRLLYAFTGYITGDGDVVRGLADLVDFIDVDDAALCGVEIVVGGLQQLQQEVFDVFADIARFGERGGIADGEGDLQDSSKSPGQQGLAGTGMSRSSARWTCRVRLRESSFSRCMQVACSDCERQRRAYAWHWSGR